MICHSCLQECSGDFCRACSKRLFGFTRFSATLPFTMPELRAKCNRHYRISISGVQQKFSLRVNNAALELTDNGGTFILKPATSALFDNTREMPANEHVCMQIARQVFHIETADCAFVKFQDGTPAYITKRFDVSVNGKIPQEDFAQVAGLSPGEKGSGYKYDYSYEEIANLMERYVSTYSTDAEKFLKLILFNYVICNGDAHVKNFSIYAPNNDGIYKLTPAYDLLNTALHVQELGRTALELFKDDYETDFYKANAFYGKADFLELARRIGIREIRAERILTEICSKQKEAFELLERSYLGKRCQKKFKSLMKDRLKALQIF